MITKLTFLVLSITFSHFINGAESHIIDIDGDAAVARSHSSSMIASAASSVEIARRTGLKIDRVSRVHEALGVDFERNVNDVVFYRRCFRKAANISEALGNGLLYVGSGLSTIAAVIKLTGASEETSNLILFASAALVGAHVTFIGMAKCAAREASEREHQLGALAETVGFHITSVLPTVTDDAEDAQTSHV